jgi:hypothetical protein
LLWWKKKGPRRTLFLADQSWRAAEKYLAQKCSGRPEQTEDADIAISSSFASRVANARDVPSNRKILIRLPISVCLHQLRVPDLRVAVRRVANQVVTGARGVFGHGQFAARDPL